MATAKKAVKKATKKVAKKTTVKKAVVAAIVDPIKQAYILMAHATANKLGLRIGSYLETMYEPMIPPGCNLARLDNNMCGDFQGIDADGNFVVDGYPSAKRFPFTALDLQASNLTNLDDGDVRITLNDEYDAVIRQDDDDISVGCQDIHIDRVRDLVKAFDESRAPKPEVVTQFDLNPQPTFIEAKPVVKKAAKKLAKKRAKR